MERNTFIEVLKAIINIEIKFNEGAYGKGEQADEKAINEIIKVLTRKE